MHLHYFSVWNLNFLNPTLTEMEIIDFSVTWSYDVSYTNIQDWAFVE